MLWLNVIKTVLWLQGWPCETSVHTPIKCVFNYFRLTQWVLIFVSSIFCIRKWQIRSTTVYCISSVKSHVSVTFTLINSTIKSCYFQDVALDRSYKIFVSCFNLRVDVSANLNFELITTVTRMLPGLVLEQSKSIHLWTHSCKYFTIKALRRTG